MADSELTGDVVIIAGGTCYIRGTCLYIIGMCYIRGMCSCNGTQVVILLEGLLSLDQCSFLGGHYTNWHITITKDRCKFVNDLYIDKASSSY